MPYDNSDDDVFQDSYDIGNGRGHPGFEEVKESNAGVDEKNAFGIAKIKIDPRRML